MAQKLILTHLLWYKVFKLTFGDPVNYLTELTMASNA